MLKPRLDLLLRFLHSFIQLPDYISVFFVDKCDGGAGVSAAAGPPDAVDVVVNAAWHIVVDYVQDIGDVKPAGSHRGGYEHGTASTAEF